MKMLKKKAKRGMAGLMVAFLILSNFLSDFPVFDSNAYVTGETILSGSAGWKFYCIDSYELLGDAGGIQGTNEWYAYVTPSTRLSKEDTASLFWATLSMLAGKGEEKCAKAFKNINDKASAAGLSTIYPVTEDHLKKLIHSPGVRDKYPWLKTVVANEDKYIEMAGLQGNSSGSTSTGGKTIPTVLQNHEEVSSALEVNANTFTIQFDSSGADKEFIQKVPLKFSPDGGNFKPELIGGWTYQKTDTSIIFTNPNPIPPQMTIQFDPAGTEYQSGKGFTSAQDAYDTAFQLWICIECNDRHVYHSQKKMPLEAHQRLVNLVLDDLSRAYYASLAGNSVKGETSGSIAFQVYRHAEDMISTYNLQLYKYDYETGKPLENAVFKLYERFDDKDQIDTGRDGPVHIYKGGSPYGSYHKDSPVIWEGFKFVSGLSTDENGYASKTVNHGYYYEKTFCDGHPAPVFVSVPSEEEDPETGELLNEDEIAGAQAENIRLAQAWTDCVDDCEIYASGKFDGVHFHWLMPEVDTGEIAGVLATGGAEGEAPDAGTTTSASDTESFEESGCAADAQDTYDKFISLKYSYALMESTARAGYALHGIHTDDLPIEVITTDSSENGANADFAGLYGKDIKTNGDEKVHLAGELSAMRKKPGEYKSETASNEPEAERLRKETHHYLQELLPFSFLENQENSGESDLIDDITGTATPGNAYVKSEVHAGTASPSDYRTNVWFHKDDAETNTTRTDSMDSGRERGSELFSVAYDTASGDASVGTDIVPGAVDRFSHCNNRDNCRNAWRIYDHRTEGEIHINKKDMDLEAKENEEYDSYGDTQGDSTLEGAVYGLYAATDIVHPDGKTGIIYRANNLVAVATTNRDGNASFMANTEIPGHWYDYAKGEVAETTDGWADQAQGNLYIQEKTYDDYSEDNVYVRVYPDYEAKNGNGWIGRPLLMGNYYVKELARSEGYELSIGNKDHALTNNGQDYNMSLPVGTGYANISRNFLAEGQISSAPTGEFGNPDVNELFFTAESRGTGTGGFDVVLNQIPARSKLFRLDTGTKVQEIQVGTGVYDKVYLSNEDGSPRYVKVEHDYQYPKYSRDGSMMTVEQTMNYKAVQFLTIAEKLLDTIKTQTAMEAAEPSMKQAEVQAKLVTEFSVADKNFMKGKLERALRANGKNTPRAGVSGGYDYSSIDTGIYDEGIREGEADIYGISGVEPGQPAAKTMYGAPVITMELSKTDIGGGPIKTGDVLISILDFYNTQSFYSYGGIHAVEENAEKYLITVYAGVLGNPANFQVQINSSEAERVIYHRVPYVPEDEADHPRYMYATYSNHPGMDGFGRYTDYKEEIFGSTLFASATLVTDAIAEGDGTLVSKTISQNVYYVAGEIPLDERGNPIQAFSYEEQTTTMTQEVEVNKWVELPVQETAGTYVGHVDSTYTDDYGSFHEDTEKKTYQLRILLPVKEITLTQEDVEQLPASDWMAGEEMGSASYYLNVKHGTAQAYLNYQNILLKGDGSYVKKADLIYPGQQFAWQDGAYIPGTHTRLKPIGVQERIIRQKVKVRKSIDCTSPQSYESNTYSEVHKENQKENKWGQWLAGAKDWLTTHLENENAGKLDNFRFKIYLKSNLERLSRDDGGLVIWEDRNGDEVTILEYLDKFPEKVPKIYTFKAKRPILEPIQEKDGEEKQGYNYEKFFQAVLVANLDKWDNLKDRDEVFSGWEEWNPKNGTMHFFAQKTRTQSNTGMEANWNARSSDMVSQFAITWYLREEVARLRKEDEPMELTYGDALYDKALYEALRKAQDYLTPFFRYDLDRICSIQWDGEDGGGDDKDNTTLSADFLKEHPEGDYYYGVSTYLPYGTYVVAEQQPYENKPGRYDFYNKHFKIDAPKEITLPAVYGEDGSDEEPEVYDERYRYHFADTPSMLAAKYLIRFNEEWAYNHTDDRRGYEISGHDSAGDRKIYKYGLEAKRKQELAPSQRGVSISETGGIQSGINTMTGVQTAYDGKYAPMLVPWSVLDSVEAVGSDRDAWMGYAHQRFQNFFYRTRFRIEKADLETGESILHDEAIFAIYAASREDDKTGKGSVICYEKPTVITGKREFLEAMGATNLYPLAREIPDPKLQEGIIWYGTVPAGTPVCLEEERIVLSDSEGGQTGVFRAFSTRQNGEMRKEEDTGLIFANQNTGYLETPKPIGAGVYVLAELKPPAGYVRSRPVAIEVYSDQTAYYQEGESDNRVIAADFEEESARIFVGNQPTRLRVSKKEDQSETITYPISGRVEGSITALNGRYGLENLELAYNASGTYMGYGWKKGTMEYLSERKRQGEAVEMVYKQGIFSGYATITRPRVNGQETNSYVAGALLTLYDGIVVKPNGDSQDYAYDGVVVERDRSSNVKRIYVKEGYGGSSAKLACQFGHLDGKNHLGDCIWDYRRVQRTDTDILFYDLGGLDVAEYGPGESLYGYNVEGVRIRMIPGITTEAYAKREGKKVFKIVSESLEALVYDNAAKAFITVPPDAVVYHLDHNGNPDAMVNPYTGMAYALSTDNKIVVWPTTIIKDASGKVIARNKIKTSRIATIHADTREEYIGGTFDSRKPESFQKWMKPVLNRYGLVRYYAKSGERYETSRPVHDRDGTFGYDLYADALPAYNEDAYMVKDHRIFDKGILWEEADNGQVPLFMRQGDHYILENTWRSGDRTPNDPFNTEPSEGQPDDLKRVIPGTYILEEPEAPSGYAPAMPIGVCVEEIAEIQTTEMRDEAIKVEISKVDAPESHKVWVRDFDKLFSTQSTFQEIEGVLSYSYGQLPGVTLSLYHAKKVYTTDTGRYPKGWYYEKLGSVLAQWTTTEAPIWLERIPKGTYILEENQVPDGYVRSYLPLEIEETGVVQTFFLPNDHTKLELFKYQEKNGKKVSLPNAHAAELSLYQVTMDADGKLHYSDNDLIQAWKTNDCMAYTGQVDLQLYGKWGILDRIQGIWKPENGRYSGFQYDFERMYRQYGTEFDTIHWYYTESEAIGTEELPLLREGVATLIEEDQSDQTGYVRQVWETKEGNQIRIGISGAGVAFEYQYHYRRLSEHAFSYDTPEGIHRIDGLSWNPGTYLLVETETPDGYQPAEPRFIRLSESGDVQLYGMENKPKPVKPEIPPEVPTTEETTPEETTPEEPAQPETTPTATEPETTIPLTQPETGEPETIRPESPSGEPEEGGSSPSTAVTIETSGEIPLGRISAIYDRGNPVPRGRKDWAGRFLARAGEGAYSWLWLTLLFSLGAGLYVYRRRKRDEKDGRQE